VKDVVSTLYPSAPEAAAARVAPPSSTLGSQLAFHLSSPCRLPSLSRLPPLPPTMKYHHAATSASRNDQSISRLATR